MDYQDSLRAPDIDRLIATLRGEHSDRVPLLEDYIQSPTLDHVLGRMRHGSTDDPTMPAAVAAREAAGEVQAAGFYADMLSASSTLSVPPADYLEFCRRASIDAMVVWLSWTGLHSSLVDRGEVADWSDIEGMVPPPDMAAVRDRLRSYQEVAASTPVGVGAQVHSCFARTYEALGFENFALKLYDDLELIVRLMDIFTDYAAAVAETVAAMDIPFFWLCDDLADNHGLMIRPQILRELWFPRTARILAPIRARGIPIIYHCDGNLTAVIPFALGLGVSALQPVQPNCNDIYQIKRDFGDRLSLIGNLDVAGSLVFGTPAEVLADAHNHIERLGIGGRYILGSSHSITGEVPPENFQAMVEAAVTYGQY